jgi:hypothetical protein
MDHVIRFNGYVSWEGQSNGLPSVIYAYLLMKGYDRTLYNDAIEAQTGAFLRMQAMICQKDQGAIIDMNKMPADRMVVPMKWITRMDVDVLPMTREMTMPDNDGVERLENGTEPVKH